MLLEGIRAHGHRDVIFAREKDEIPEILDRIVRPRDLVITMGAGDIWRVGEIFGQMLGKRARETDE
jgi:UDP-N-acetylmuramate--alanine ligase